MRPNAVSVFAAALALASCGASPDAHQQPSVEAVEATDNAAASVDEAVIDNAADAGVDVAENASTSPRPNPTALPGDTETPPDPNPTIRTRSLIECPILRRRTSKAQCDSVTEQAAALEQGVGAFAAPKTMVVGQPQDVSFAVGKAAEAADTAEAVGGTTDTTVQVRTRIGRFMTATLTGGGFDIEGVGTPERDLGASASEVWTWRVTPRQQGPRTLMLTVKVDAVDDDGQRTRITLSSKTVAVNVGVTSSDRRRAIIKETKDTIDETGEIWPSLEKWLAGLAGVLLVLGLVIWRFKLLGKKPEEPVASEAPAPAEDVAVPGEGPGAEPKE